MSVDSVLFSASKSVPFDYPKESKAREKRKISYNHGCSKPCFWWPCYKKTPAVTSQTHTAKKANETLDKRQNDNLNLSISFKNQIV